MPYTPQGMRQEMLTIAHALLRQTMQDKIKWSSTDDDQFLYSSAKSSLLVHGEVGNYDLESTPEDEGDFSLVLLNRNGSITGRFEVEFGAVYDDPEESDRYQEYVLLKQLYYEVQSRALEIDTTLEDIHQALGLTTTPESARPDDPQGGDND